MSASPFHGYLDYSIIIPVYNSEAIISELIQRVENCMSQIDCSYEIIAVDDCSNDNSWQLLLCLRDSYRSLRTFRMKMNVGQVAAVTCGIKVSFGRAIITLDDDLQYPPSEIGRLITAYENNLRTEVVCGIPKKRKHSLLYNFLSVIAKIVLKYIYFPRYRNTFFYTSFKLYDRNLFFQNNKWLNYHPLYFWEIFPKKYTHVYVEHQPRQKGKSNYNLRKLIYHYKPVLYTIAKRTILFLALLLFIVAVLCYYLFTNKIILIILLLVLGGKLLLYFILRKKLHQEKVVNCDNKI